MNAPRASTGRSGLRVSERVLTVVGGIAAFLGVFILLGGDNQYIEIGGDVSWRVSDLSVLWGWGLAAAGTAMLLTALTLYRRDRRRSPTQVQPSNQADLTLHTAVFVLVNALLWIQDLATGEGLNYVWWITVPWGIGLAAHAIAVVTENRGQGPRAAR